MTEKPHKGSIKNWYKYGWFDDGGLGYLICGTFVDHERFAGESGHTSYVVAHDTDTGEIETRNSRYTLIGPERDLIAEREARSAAAARTV